MEVSSSTATTSTRGVSTSSTSTSSNSIALRISRLSRSVRPPSFSASLTIVISSPSVMVSSSSLWKCRLSSFFHWPNSQVNGVNRVIRTCSTGATAPAILSGISLARLFGDTSPKIRMIMVSTRVDSDAPSSSPTSRVNKTALREAAAIFTILLPIRIVESSLSYCSASACMRAAEASPSSARLFTRIMLREEKAVSDAEKKADMATRITRAITVVILPSSIKEKINSAFFLINSGFYR